MKLQHRRDAKGKELPPRLIHTGTAPEQNFSDRTVEAWVDDGIAVIAGAELVLKTEEANLGYTIKRRPGYYCVSTGERIPVSERAWQRFRASGLGVRSREEALAWLAAQRKAPTDYEVTCAYECVLDAEQHAQWRAVRDIAGNVVAACTAEA